MLLTGVHMRKHNVLGNDFNEPNLSEYPPFFYFLEEIEIDINTVSLVNWLPIEPQFSQQGKVAMDTKSQKFQVMA